VSPRPRTVEDDDVLDAAERVRAELGPMRFTIDELARQLGVSAPALLRRFGSKRALLLAVKEREVRRTRDLVVRREPGKSALTALLDRFRDGVAITAPSPDELANSLAFLHLDTADPLIRPLILKQVASLRFALRDLLAAAIADGELTGVTAETLADLVEVTYNGALVGWVVDRKGSSWEYVRPRLEALLAPYRQATRARRKTAKPKGARK
jgi:AcrR family transcriptional regulator